MDKTCPGAPGGPLEAVRRAAQNDAGRQLRHDYWEMFGTLATVGPDSVNEWQAAVGHGATLDWALRTANEVIGGVSQVSAFSVGRALRLASVVPVEAIEGLLVDGWDLIELTDLTDLMDWTDAALSAAGFLVIVRRIKALNPAAAGSDVVLFWHAVAAVLSSGPAGLTDLQALRWLQVLANKTVGWVSQVVLAVSLTDSAQRCLREWAAAAGPDGWGWLMAGYTPEEAAALRELPETHSDRPGPDQLAVMAALRQT